MCSKSAEPRYTSNSLGTYTLETPTVLWSPISLVSLCASSTGCTLDLKARPKPPSTAPSSFFSAFLKIPIVSLLRRVAGRQNQRQEYHGGSEHHTRQERSQSRRIAPDGDRQDAVRGEDADERERPDPQPRLQAAARESETHRRREGGPGRHLQQARRREEDAEQARRRGERVAGGREAGTGSGARHEHRERAGRGVAPLEAQEGAGAGPCGRERAAHAAQHGRARRREQRQAEGSEHQRQHGPEGHDGPRAREQE